ncbi:UPF0668 protein C10orf76 homolog [Strongyloides ratti]|uniref:UPF0668 protein C10orf76 homolog n=1 Tax=Strongyloides ratti TaxID=34506 RepID=A0A090LTW6_STRRB|nr:UPF0668 protein C10orf76 homolog [Strongyloides ratti]CEF71089.1 UPF0668 protein C10orf76 homolog [Strongyloides ratti]
MEVRLKIVTLYREIFDNPSVIEEEFNWSEFFLLKHAEKEFINVLDENFGNEEKFEKNCFVTQRIIERAIKFIAISENKVHIRNACETLRTIVEYVLSKYPDNQRWEIISNHYSFAIFGAFSVKLTSMLKEYNEIEDDEKEKDYREILLIVLKTAVSLVLSSGDIQKNRLIPVFLQPDFSSALQNNIGKKSHYSIECKIWSMKLLCHILSFSFQKQQNPFVVMLSRTGDEMIMLGFREILIYLTRQYIEKFKISLTNILDEKNTLFNSLSSPLFNIFSTNTNTSKVFDSDSLILECITHVELFLFTKMLISSNKDFITFMMINPINDTGNNLFLEFLCLSSFIFGIFKGESSVNKNSRAIAYNCLYIINQVMEDHYAQNIIVKSRLGQIVPLMRADFQHKPFSIDYSFANDATIIEYLVEILTEFSLSHIMKKFPFEHYNLVLNIFHLILLRIRSATITLPNWQKFFQTMVSLVAFITPKLQGDNDEIVSKYCMIFYKLLIVKNFFITHGDSFIPNAESYSFLYYEIIRQKDLYVKIMNIVEEKLKNEKYCLREWFVKIELLMDNINLIQNYFTSKFEEEGDYIYEDVVLNMITNSLSGMTLRLHAELEIAQPLPSFDTEFILYKM